MGAIRKKKFCNFLIHAAPSNTLGTQINFRGNLAVLPFTATQNLTLSITGKTDPGIDDTILSTWYLNGNSLPLGSKLEPLKRPLLNVSRTLSLENSSILDAGTYEVLLAIDTYTHTSSLILDVIITTILLLVALLGQIMLFLPKQSLSSTTMVCYNIYIML